MTSDDDRGKAVQQLEALRTTLTEASNAAELTPLIDECESLVSAVKTFHMEGIRFRMYNLRRQLAEHEQTVPAEAPPLFDEARAALEAAGFQTK